MVDHQVLVYIHILLMVFWIGTDVGVYIAGLYFIDPKLSLAQRKTAIDLGLVIDRYPRICFVAILPVGVQLAYDYGFLPIGPGALTAIWLLSAVWMLAVVMVMRKHGGPEAKPWQLVERAFQVTGLFVLTGTGLYFLFATTDVPAWLAGKLIMLGAICLFSILLERAFGPTIVAFGAIAEQGSTPDREAVLRRCMYATYVWVLGIYAAILVAGFLGTVKP